MMRLKMRVATQPLPHGPVAQFAYHLI